MEASRRRPGIPRRQNPSRETALRDWILENQGADFEEKSQMNEPLGELMTRDEIPKTAMFAGALFHWRDD